MKRTLFLSVSSSIKIILFGLFFSLFCTEVQAQEQTPASLSKINLYADLGGGFARGMTSINIEGRIYNGRRITWYGRGGIGAGGIDDNGGPGILGGITMLTGKRNGHFEISTGALLGKYTDVEDEIFVLPIADLGYRYQKPEGGLIFRIRAGFLGIGFSLGYAF